MSSPKRNHFLPQFYVKGFCNRNGRVWLYDWTKEEYRCQQPDKVGHERHFYALYTEGGSRDVSVERMLADIENMTKPVIEKVDRKEKLTQSDREILGCFAALMYTRVPRFRDKELTTLERAVNEARLSVDARSRMASALREKPFRQLHFVRAMLDTVRKHSPEFCGMDWVIARAPDEKTFVTSDDPLTPTPAEDYTGSLNDVQLTRTGIGKVLPLTVRSCLVILDQGSTSEYWDVDTDFVRKMNCNQAFMSPRFIIGRDKKLLVSLVKQAIPVRKRIAVELAS